MIKNITVTILLFSIFISCKSNTFNLSKEIQEENNYVLAYKNKCFL